MGDIFGWLFLPVILMIPFLVPSIRQSKGLVLIFTVSTLIRFWISMNNAYFEPFFGSDKDAIVMHEDAALWAEHRIVGTANRGHSVDTYISLLAFVYASLGESQFLGHVVSILFSILGGVVLNALVNLLNLHAHRLFIVGLYLMSASSLLFQSSLLREPFQQFFFLLLIYCMALYHLRGGYGAIILMAIAALLVSKWHTALLAVAPLAFVLALVIRPRWMTSTQTRNKAGHGVAVIGLGVVALIGGFFVAAKFFSSGFSWLEIFLQTGVLENIAGYQDGAFRITARSKYAVPFDPTSITALPILLWNFFQYMFGPLPWQIAAGMDLYAALEGMLRLFLTIGFFVQLKNLPRDERRLWILIGSTYFALCFIFSAGTINYGTSARHHLVGNGVLLVMGAAYVRRLFLLDRRPSTPSLEGVS